MGAVSTQKVRNEQTPDSQLNQSSTSLYLFYPSSTYKFDSFLYCILITHVCSHMCTDTHML